MARRPMPTEAMKDAKLGVAIVEGALTPEAQDLAIDLAESELDSFLDEGVLKEIPGIKVIIACKKTWGAIHDRLFLRKVSDFLRSTPKFSKEEVDRFVVEHWRGNEAKRLGETLVLLLDRLDDLVTCQSHRPLQLVFLSARTSHRSLGA
jgi:hypothetical protein